ncbi:diguanylate cyclase/phosphodiesterase (GGDEF & EAL domains) with PAS/PAC sensor(s) [hydrothermal vent metagenome]|uniref:Diguanylate cyclase/phosphodiesterase (GGDEF & EAL domains) with PAS/PAC sensor(S) n=1 Tax=hydrothermal vent metagenome TaxID=652676 RepID=A0A3B1AG49_9ZZZZ
MSNATTVNNIKSHKRISPIALQLVIYIVIASSVITIFTSAFQLYQIYKTHISGIELRLNEIRDSYSNNISTRVWVTNLKELENTLQGILRLPDIEYIAVYEGDNILAIQGKIPEINIIELEFPLQYEFRNKNINIGRIYIVASLAETYKHLIEQALAIILSNAIKTFIISGFILLLVYQLIARHLISLGRFAEQLDINSLDNKLVLKRKDNPKKIDELDQLSLTLTNLQYRLKNSIHELKDSQAQVQLLLDSTAEAIYGLNIKGECTFANTACLNMLGYDNDSEVLNQNMHNLIHHHYPDGTQYPVEDCKIFQAFILEKGSHVDNEVLWRKDGSSFDAEYWSYPIFKNEQCIGAVVTFLDITERIQSQKSIRENESNLEITLNSIGDAVITTDPNGNVRRMNPAAEHLTGWNLKEALGKPLKNIFTIVNATTREAIENPVDHVIKTGEIIHLSNHTTLISKDGSEYQISDSAAPIQDNDIILGMVLVFNDITEQYQLRELAEKRKHDLQAIMDHSPAMIYVKDISGHYIFINLKYEQLFHINRKDIIGKTDQELFAPEFADEFQRNDRAVIDAGHALESEESAPLDDGVHTYVSVKFPLFDDKNHIYAICGISTDITEHRHKEDQLRHSQKMDALGKLTGGIAHDYNNILGIVLGYAEQIHKYNDNPEKVSKFSHNILHAAERGSKLAKKLLAFSRNKKQHDLSIITINELIQEQQHLLEKTLTARIKLSLDLTENIWPFECDSNDLEDAIINISINALHAMSTGGQLTVRTSNEQLGLADVQHLNIPTGDYILLSITDTGCGMDSNTKNKIFDPFYTTKGDHGTGLGLSQVYGFMESCGGFIKVYSELNHGSRFALYFPRSNQSITNQKQAIQSETQNLMGTETLLVVDDEPDMLNLVYDIFKVQGYKVLTANDGEQALQIFENNPVDLIISDVIMPNMDGYQLATKVLQNYPQTKIQMVSGFSDERHNNMMDTSLYTNMIYKPYTSNTILVRVRELLDDKPINQAKINSSLATILVLDDDEDILELFKIKLRKLNYKVLTVVDGENSFKIYKNALATKNPIDIVIVDLTIPNSIGGIEVADKIRKIHPSAKIIVASGHSQCDEMKNPKKFGFDAAIEKDFDSDKLKNTLDDLLR